MAGPDKGATGADPSGTQGLGGLKLNSQKTKSPKKDKSKKDKSKKDKSKSAESDAPEQSKSKRNPTTSWTALQESLEVYFDTPEQIKTWMRSDLFAPTFRKFWNRFYKPTYLEGNSGEKKKELKSKQPKQSQIMTQLQAVTDAQDTRYVRDGSDAVLVNQKAGSIECYAWFIANITKQNEEDRRGKLRIRPGVTQDFKWRMVDWALRKCIHDQMKGNAQTVITQEYLDEDNPTDSEDDLEQAEIDQGNVEKEEGVTIYWRNRNHPYHGIPKPPGAKPEQPREYLHNVRRPFTIKYAWEVRNRARDHFEFPDCNLFIAKAYIYERLNKDKIVKRPFTQQKWDTIRNNLPNNRGHIFVVIETTKNDEWGLPVYESPSSGDLPHETSRAWDLNEAGVSVDYPRFISPTLELVGEACVEFDQMKAEREDDEDLEPGFHHRMDRYEALLKLATRTNGRTDGDVTNQHRIAGKPKSKVVDRALTFDYYKEQEILGKALEGDPDQITEHGVLEHLSRIGDNVFSQEISESEREQFEKAQEWTDNTKFQRENVEEANELLGIENPEDLTVPGMNTPLKFWQPVASAATFTYLLGPAAFAFLLDTVGLGKTIEILAVIQTFWNKRDALKQERARLEQFGPEKPILLVVPANLMPQWLGEILKHLPDANIKIYHPDFPTKKKIQDPRVEYFPKTFVLERDHDLFDKTKVSGRTIVITSPTVFANRNGPRAQEKWRQKEGKFPGGIAGEEEREAMFRILDETWPACLSGLWSLVICDEGHFAKNGMKVFIGVALEWLRKWPKPTPMAIMTATPMPGGALDLPGYFEILEKHSGPWTNNMLKAASKAIKQQVGLEDNPFHLPDCPEVAALRQTTYAIKKYIVKNPNPVEQGRYIEKLLETCSIKRGLGSRVPFKTGPKIDSELPAKLHKVIKLKFTEDEYALHRELHNIALNELAFKLKHAPEGARKVVFDMAKIRLLTLFTTSSKFAYLSEKTLNDVDRIRKLIDKGEWGLRDFADLICEEANSRSAQLVPPGDDMEDLLNWFADGSPKTRHMSWILAEVVVKMKEKLLIYCGGPWQQIFWTVFVKAFEIKCASFHAGLSPADRSDLTDSFNSSRENSLQVMVVTYAVGGSGLNWHFNCFNMAKTDPANNDDQDIQAIGRIFRILQLRNCRIWDFIVEQSWNVWQVANSSNKSLAQLMACLNTEYFNRSVQDGGYGDQEIDEEGNVIHKGSNFETFVREGGQLVKLSAATGKGEKKPLTGANLLRELRDILYGGGETTGWTKARGRMFLEPDDPALTALLPLPEKQGETPLLPQQES